MMLRSEHSQLRFNLNLRRDQIDRLSQLDGTGWQSNTIVLKAQLFRLLVHYHPSSVKEITILSSIVEVLRCEDDARVRFCEECHGYIYQDVSDNSLG